MNVKRTQMIVAGLVLGVMGLGAWSRAQEGVTVLLPDLKVHSISAPASASRGSSIAVSDVTTNIGTASAAQSTSRIYICTNLNEVTATWLVTNHTVSSLMVGRSWTWSGNVTVPAGQPLGTNYYVVVANATRTVTELNYNNNTNYVVLVVNP